LGTTTDGSNVGFFSSFKKFFLRGVAALLPTLLTIAILIWAYDLVDIYIGQYINEGFIRTLARLVGAPAQSTVDPDVDTLRYGTRTGELDEEGRWITREYKLVHHPAHRGDPTQRGDETLVYRIALWRIAFAKYKLGLAGFLLAIVLVYFMGFFVVASFIGRTAWGLLERFQQRVPLVNAIYPYVKQVTDFLLSEKRVAFHGVVAVEYPRKGLWSLGLLTGTALRSLGQVTRGDLVTVFIPSSPTPVTGYVITVPRSDVIELSLSIDEALRFTISGGVIKPDRETSEGELSEEDLTTAIGTSFHMRPLAPPAAEDLGPQGTSGDGSDGGTQREREEGHDRTS